MDDAVTRLAGRALRRLAEPWRLAFGRLEQEPTFEDALDEAVEMPEIRAGAEPVGLSQDDLREWAAANRTAIEERTIEARDTFTAASRRAGSTRNTHRLSLLAGCAVAVGYAVVAAVLGSWTSAGAALLFAIVTLNFNRGRGLATRDELAAATAMYRRALLRDAVVPALRERINRELENVYDLTLHFESARGLAELADESFDVSTRASDDLRALVAEMPAASLGVAGPRGAGKSTLIRAVSTGRYRVPERLPVLVSAPVDYEPREFILHLYASLCWAIAGPVDLLGRYGRVDRLRRLVLATLALLATYAGVLLVVFDPDLALSGARLLGVGLAVTGGVICLALMVGPLTRGRPTVSELPPGLVHRALQRLERIRFLQTFSEGWGGDFKLPLGTLKAAGERRLAEQQATLPELVAEFKDWAGQVAETTGGVVIGIDELDKIHDLDDARRFMNDIKGIFGIPKCFFLVSISEDALANFDRRGMPIRDAFDSSLDDVVRVGYLDVGTTRRLLQRRVIGLGEGYVALCHVLGGDLPRDVIRVARRLAQLRPDADEPAVQLAGACRTLVEDDFDIKRDAAVSAANTFSPFPRPPTSSAGCGRHRLRSVSSSSAPFRRGSGSCRSPGPVRPTTPRSARSRTSRSSSPPTPTSRSRRSSCSTSSRRSGSSATSRVRTSCPARPSSTSSRRPARSSRCTLASRGMRRRVSALGSTSRCSPPFSRRPRTRSR